MLFGFGEVKALEKSLQICDLPIIQFLLDIYVRVSYTQSLTLYFLPCPSESPMLYNSKSLLQMITTQTCLFLFYLFTTMESRSYINKTTNHFKEKSHPTFVATTISQNFFNSNDFDDFQYSSVPSKSQIIPRRQQTRRASTRKKEQTAQLLPVKQAEKVEVFKNTIKNKADDLEEIIFLQSTERKPLRRRSSLKHQMKEQILQIPAMQKIESPFQQPPKAIAKPLKQKQQQIKHIQQKSVLVDQQPILLPLRPTIMFKDQEDQQEQGKDAVIGSSKSFDFQNEQELRKMIFSEIKENTLIRMEIIRDKGGFNRFWPQFHLRFADDKRQLMSAKKTSSRPASTFIISRSITDFQENSTSYLGKVKSNVLGDTYNIFGPGLNPSNASQKKIPPRDLLATLMYNTSLFYVDGPRKFSVFMKEPQLNYYKDFPQVQMYEQQIPLSTLFSYHANKQKIKLFYNKKPHHNQKNNTYFLDFKGKAPVSSVKNFILQQRQGGPQVLLFGKVSEDCFNLQMSSHISPYIAFAVAMASFDHRLISQ